MIPVRANVRGRAAPVATGVLIAINVLVFLFELSIPRQLLDAFLSTWGLVPAREWIALTQAPGRLDLWLTPPFTSMFLHGGWGHLLGNMLYLWVFGSALERRLGSGRLLLMYFAGGLAASQGQALAAATSTLPMIGASGAIAAVLGAYLIVYPLSSVTVLVPVFFYPLFFRVPALLFLGLWFLEQLYAGGALALSPGAQLAGGVAWWAHIGGFLAGAILMGLFWNVGREEPPPRPVRRPERWPADDWS